MSRKVRVGFVGRDLYEETTGGQIQVWDDVLGVVDQPKGFVDVNAEVCPQD